MNITRRQFLTTLGVGGFGMLPFSQALAKGLPKNLLGTSPLWIPSDAPVAAVPTNYAAKGRVVVIGGGMAGATVAKYLRMWGGAGVDVTMVERNSVYVSNIMSNLVLNNLLTLNSLNFNWDHLAKKYGVKRVTGDVQGIDPVNKKITLAGRTVLPYDKLVVAPGIEFDSVHGLETTSAQLLVPHAWEAGAQTDNLRAQIQSIPDGGVFLMSIPKKPYRCPPGPYERACVVADYFKRNKIAAKVIVLDENSEIVAEKASFTVAFATLGVDYRPGIIVHSVNANARQVVTSAGTITANVLNIIPNQRAGAILTNNSLVNVDGRWAGVDVLSYESTAAVGVHVIGDSSATTQPKAGHVANQEAKVCADAIVRFFLGLPPDQSPMTNSACYSAMSATTASWLTDVYAYDPTSRAMKQVVTNTEESAATEKNMDEMRQWFSNLMTDSFA